MIWSAALLMRKHGVDGTSFSEVIARSGAPRGSIYHHFPGGKAELIEEATRYAGEFIASGLAAALSEEDPVSAIADFASAWGAVLRRSDFSAGCPVVAATLANHETARARDAAGEAFGKWEELLANALRHRIDDGERAGELATLVIAAVEGAVLLSRAQQSTAPLERVTKQLEVMLRAEITGQRSLR